MQRLFFIVILLSFSVSAQEQIRFEHITINDGLPQNTVRSITQSRDGYMWFATQQGLAKYDGYGFKLYQHEPFDLNSIASSQINCVFEDANGTLWIGTERDGLDKFERATETFKHFRHDPANSSSISSNEILYVYQAKEELNTALWIQTKNGINKFDFRTETFTLAPSATKPTVSFENIRREFVEEFFRQQRGSMPNGITEPEVPHVAEENGNVAWFGTFNGLIRIEKNKSSTHSPPFFVHRFQHNPGDPFSLSDDIIMSLYQDKFGVLWVGTFTGGVNVFRKWKEKFTPYSYHPKQAGGFQDSYVRSLTVDRKGTVWIGGTTTGLWKYERPSNTYKNYLIDKQSTSSMGNSVRTIMEDEQGLLWVGTDVGLFYFQTEDEQLVPALTGEYAIPELRASNVWPIYKDPIIPSIWIGAPSVLIEYQTDKNNFLGHRGSFGNKNIYSVTSDSTGNLWIGFYNNGLAKFDTRRKTIIQQYTHDDNDNSTLSNNRIWSLHTDTRGTIWIGTDGGGLDKLNEDGKTFSHFTMNDGLPSNIIFGILEDSHCNLWLSTGNGVSKFSPETQTFRNYTVADGLMSKEFNGHSSAMSAEGEMFFGGVNGFISFFPDEVNDDPTPPQIVLTGFKKFDSLVTFSQSLEHIKQIELKYEENVFTFEFAAIHFTDPQRNQHAYMLEGFDRGWIYCGSRKNATYTNLNPGTYFFKVKGSNCDGVWNEEGISITLIVHPPFWLTWWFLSLSGLIFVGSIIGTARYISVRKIKRKLELLEHQHALEKERLRISKDMHDDLGARITEISLVTQLARKDTENSKVIQGHLQNISTSAEEIITSFDEIVWAVNPENDTLNNLADYISQFTIDFLQKANIKARLEIPMDIPDFPLSTEVRHNVFMVVKETLNNIVKYSGASEVHFGFFFENNSLRGSIQDNGKGFDRQEIGSFSYGLKNMQKRIEDLGGSFELNSEKGKGTGMNFMVPLKR